MNLFNDSIAIALSWTLLHSLWQGGIIAIISGIILLFLKGAKSAQRYNMLTVSFLVFLIVVICTYYNNLYSTISSDNPLLNSSVTESINTYTSAYPSGYEYASFATIINQNIGLVFNLWLVFFVLKIIVFGKQIIYLRSIRTKGLSELPASWAEKINTLAKAMGLDKSFDVYQSTLVNVPSVIGMLKPIVLMPLGLINQLPSDQIEAILLHELAHIKRNDFILNLVQRITELFFFFNPGLVWLSSTLDNEREHCCDEMAISIHQDKKSFVNALVGFNEVLLAQNNLALGFGNNKKYLINRAKRILFNKPEGLANFDKTMLVICFLLTAFSSFNYMYNSTNEIASVNSPLEISAAHLDTIPNNESMKHKLEREILMLSSQADSLKYTNTKTGEEQQKMIKRQLEKLAKLQSELLNIQNETLSEDVTKRAIDSKKMEEDSRRMKEDSKQMEEDSKQMEKDSKQMEKDSKQMKEDSKQMEKDSKQMEKDSKQMEKDSKQMEKDSKQMEKDSKQMEEDSRRMKEDSKKMEKEAIDQDRQNAIIDKKVSKIIETLMKDNIITKKENLSFSLSKDEMIVNGVKQSISVTKKYFDAYGVNGRSLVHNFQYESKKK